MSRHYSALRALPFHERLEILREARFRARRWSDSEGRLLPLAVRFYLSAWATEVTP